MHDGTGSTPPATTDSLRIERAPFVQVPKWLLRAVSPRSLQVWCALAAYADSDGTRCFPGQPRLAADLDCSERTVRDALAELEQANALEVHRKPGLGNAYRLRLTNPTPAETCRTPRQEPAGDPGSISPPTENHYLDPSTEATLPLASLARPKPPAPAAFEEWWTVYPRRVGKRAALKAWLAARRRLPIPDDAADRLLLAAAARYRDDPNRDDAFTAHPTTWLNRDGWEDAPLPPRSSVAGSTPSRSQGILAAAMERARAAEAEQQRGIER